MTANRGFSQWRPHPWHGLPIGRDPPKYVNAYVEITPFDLIKYEVDKTSGYLRVDRPQRGSSQAPALYGFIPRTYCDDGDPLDVLVLVDNPSFPGCLQEVRPIGLLEMLDQGVLDEKVLAVGKNNPRYRDIWNYSDIYPHLLKEITHFFSIYKDLEGKRVEIKGWHDASYARNKVTESTKRFEEHKEQSTKVSAPSSQ